MQGKSGDESEELFQWDGPRGGGAWPVSVPGAGSLCPRLRDVLRRRRGRRPGGRPRAQSGHPGAAESHAASFRRNLLSRLQKTGREPTSQ